MPPNCNGKRIYKHVEVDFDAAIVEMDGWHGGISQVFYMPSKSTW